MREKPNIVLIITDDQRYDSIHALGNAEIATPNMDRLVKMGTSFTEACIPGGTSGAVCMPSRAMIHTGRTLFHLQGEGQSIPDNHTTIGEHLRRQGYSCFGTGKWHNGTKAFSRSFDDGGNIFFGGMWDHWNVPVSNFDPSGEYDNVINFVENFMHSNKTVQVHCDKFNPGKHSSELVTDAAVRFLDSYEKDQPFFLYTAYLAPHDPRTMPEAFRAMYDPDKVTLPGNFMEQHPFDFGISHVRDENLATMPRTEKETRKQLAEYYGMISHLDYEIGRLTDHLHQTGKMEKTIIILAGDNGLGMGCHGLFGKQNLYDHSIRVPLVICGPGIPENETRNGYLYLFDLFPTLCDLLQIDIPESVEGISFAPLLEDQKHKIRENLYFAYNNLLRGVKNKRFKLIEYRTAICKTQLFDLHADPLELKDLSNFEHMQTIKEQLRVELINQKVLWDDECHPFGVQYWRNFKGEEVT